MQHAPIPVRRRAGGGAFAAAAAAACVAAALGLALPGARAAAGGPAGAAASAPAARAADPAAAALDALERRGPAQPPEVAAEAAQLAQALPPGTDAWRRAVVLQGSLLAQAGRSDTAERLAARLDAAAPPPPDAPLAAPAAAMLIRARIQKESGALGRADLILADARRLLPAEATGWLAHLLVLTHAMVKDERGAADEAVRLYLRALELAEQMDSRWRRADALRRLAWITATNGQLDRAEALNREALEIARADGDDLALSAIHNAAGYIHSLRGDRDAERQSARAALDHARAAKSPRTEALMLANMADFHLGNGEPALALAHAEQSLALARARGVHDSEAIALTNRGLALVALRRVAEGRRDFAASLALDEARGNLLSMSVTLDESWRALERAGDLAGALDAAMRWRALADRLDRRERQKAVVELQEAFDHAQRVRDLRLLEADGALQREQLQAQWLRTRTWLLATAALLLGMLVVLPLARRVRRTNAELAQLNRQLEAQSESDPLTGLANRRRFLATMRARAQDGRFRGSLLLVDVDHFKQINDRRGHAAGDAVLVEVAQRLLRSVRGSDLVVRWGGEEFLVVVGDDIDAAAAEALAQRVLDAIAGAPFELEGMSLGVSASVGWATFPVAPEQLSLPWERAVDLVDTALYLAKAHGRNRAYGVSALQAADEGDLAAIAASLEDAWHAGRVVLTPLNGPAPRGVAA